MIDDIRFSTEMPPIADLPLEIIDCILFALDPLDVSSVSQVSHFFHEIVYGLHHHQLWRGLYLSQSLDDPRKAVDRLGSPRTDIDWKGELQRIIRARTVVRNPDACRREERCTVLQTLLDLVSNVPPLSSPESDEMSRNIRWVQNLLEDGAVLEPDRWTTDSEEEEQLRARLHVWFGLTQSDLEPKRRQASQAFVYSRRNHTTSRNYGPFIPNENTRVDWVFMRALVHVVRLVVSEIDGDEEETYYFCPLSLSFCQSIIPRGMDLDLEEDWAGVEGLWKIGYAFVDHRELIIYNDPTVPEDEPQDTSIFEGIEETWATLDMYFRITSVEYDPAHPTRPKINYVGELDGKFSLIGFVKLIDDDQVWWHYGAGNDDQPVWNCDAIGLGSVRSQCGAVGIWSTIFHDIEDPLGPFWIKRQTVVEDD